MRKSLWSPDEDEKLRQYVAKHGCGNWSDVAKHTGLHRCGKSCRLRWINYLRPDLKRGPFTAHEVRLVVNLHNKLGNRTDNDVKNFWHSYTRSRRLAVQQQQQQQRQLMNISGPQDDDDDDDDDDEKLCYSDVYKHQESKKKKENKQHGYGAHHELQGPSLMFPPNITHIHKEVDDCKVPSINENNAAPFHFNRRYNQLACTSSNTNTDRCNQVPPFPRAHLRPSPQEVKDNAVVAPMNTNAKPVMIHDCFGNDAECVIYKGLQSCITNNQISRSKLGSYASDFYPSTSSVETSSSAVSSTSHIHDSTKSSSIQVTSAADHDWSFTFSPSMQDINGVINLQVLAEDAPEASLNQANCNGGNSKPPEGLQSVIWRFFNQKDADPAASPTSLHQENQRTHTIHQLYVPHHHHHQKPHTSTIAISSLALSAESNIQHPIQQLPATDDQLMMNVEEAFASYASCVQHLQAQVLAADCFS